MKMANICCMVCKGLEYADPFYSMKYIGEHKKNDVFSCSTCGWQIERKIQNEKEIIKKFFDKFAVRVAA